MKSKAKAKPKAVECPKCKGTGKINHGGPNYVDDSNMCCGFFDVPCGACLGTGFLMSVRWD